jgi:hypothetical protein
MSTYSGTPDSHIHLTIDLKKEIAKPRILVEVVGSTTTIEQKLDHRTIKLAVN